jgi:hypothetical protein
VASAITLSCGTQTGCNNTTQTQDFGTSALVLGGLLGHAAVNRTLTVTNTGVAGSSLVFGALATFTIAPTGQFTVQSSTCANATIASGASCVIQLQFKPGSSGLKTATLSIPSNATATPKTFSLRGTGA